MDKKLKLKTELTSKLKKETSTTGTGASVTPGAGEGVATKYAFGKRDNKGTPSDWKSAPSIPNRSSKAMDYKELWEAGEYESLVGILKQLGAEEDSIKVLIKAVEMGALKPSDVITITKKALGKKEIKELFNIYPESEDQISDPSIKAIYKLLKAVNPDVEKPISLDKSKPKVVKISRKFEKDKKALAALTKLTGKDFESYVELLKTKRGKERYTLKAEEKPIWNGVTILFGSGAENLPKGSKPFDTAASWRDTRNLALRVGLLREDEDDEDMLQEGYAKFRNETKMRSKPDQFHQAVKQIKRKMNEINRIFEYVDRLKTELSEGEDLKYKKYTENAFQQIKESAKALFLKSTKLK